MNKSYIVPNEWSIIENTFDKEHLVGSESIFSIGNGYMGQRANFEEAYSGETLQGNYIGGIYYPDKTRVGWWKNGYPEYFAKVLNAPSWIGIKLWINDEELDLNQVKVESFHRELNMKEGWLKRSFVATLNNGNKIEIAATRFISFSLKEIGVIKYEVKALNFSGSLQWHSIVDAGIINQDANYDEFFWKICETEVNDGMYIVSETLKTQFSVCTAMENHFYKNGKSISLTPKTENEYKKITAVYQTEIAEGETISLEKYAAVTQSMNHAKEQLWSEAQKVMQQAVHKGYDVLLDEQKQVWASVWETADIVIEGDIKAQQAIRFNIFQLNQTYTGEDARLNIGPKGFTGEKYGGSTYWDTEAYCIPFYMSTKDKEVARNLLKYRYNQLSKAIENAEKLGFSGGAALYPMVTMNGEECHNEWEITFEEIHRNGAMLYAIYNYINYTGDYSYIPEFGLEVMIGVSRFWAQRVNYSEVKKQYVLLGVTGPNEYENNVNNNWYTNYLAKWSLEFTQEQIEKVKNDYPSDYLRVERKTNLKKSELEKWKDIVDNMYFPQSEELGVFLQQDGFLDKEIIPVAQLPKAQRPINQKWSWDRILRSCYIKQADVLQGMYFFENQFDNKSLSKHFDFYEPITVHESSLSPCVHSILASKLNRVDKAYELYLRTSRLDLDDYNHEVDEGLHITSMAGTWLSVVQGFGGMRNFDNKLEFNPVIPKEWKSYSFKIDYRGTTLHIYKDHDNTKISRLSGEEVELWLDGKKQMV
jgi:maltose phosphorylase